MIQTQVPFGAIWNCPEQVRHVIDEQVVQCGYATKQERQSDPLL